MRDDPQVVALVARAAAGDQQAWNDIVERYAPLVWSICMRHRLSETDIEDVGQTVWLRLVEHLGNLREPDALPGWLTRTTQRECSRQARRQQRVLTLDPHSDGRMERPTNEQIDAGLLRAELRQALREGLAEVPAPYRSLLRLYASDPPKTYKEISQLLGMPIGSIGPKLRRGLNCLRDTDALRPYVRTAPAGRGEERWDPA